jgi:roadblock/LC7 domain-containing protein
MALTQTDLDNIDAAIATGELRVQFNGRLVEYRSIDELKKARAHVAEVLATAAAGGRSAGAYRFNFTTGRGD